ncbi:MAG TPA: hypothetical protein VG756_20430 [Pseudonocardiaceae bacterium]|nr:hypothetical protein [Pseudonocardiaceae bacterium]
MTAYADPVHKTVSTSATALHVDDILGMTAVSLAWLGLLTYRVILPLRHRHKRRAAASGR